MAAAGKTESEATPPGILEIPDGGPIVGRITVTDPGTYGVLIYTTVAYDALPAAERPQPAFRVPGTELVLSIQPLVFLPRFRFGGGGGGGGGGG